MKCKCADCNVEFEYDFGVSICGNCLDEYKRDD